MYITKDPHHETNKHSIHSHQTYLDYTILMSKLTWSKAPPPFRNKVKYSHAWHNAPKHIHVEINHSTQPLLIELYNTHPFKFNPQECTNTNGSFIPHDNKGACNTVGSSVYCLTNNLWIVERFPWLRNILRAKLNTIRIVGSSTQHHTQDTFVFTDQLNTIYLLHNHIRHPSSHHNHSDKPLIATIVNQIT